MQSNKASEIRPHTVRFGAKTPMSVVEFKGPGVHSLIYAAAL